MRKFKGQSLIEVAIIATITIGMCAGGLYLTGGSLSGIFKSQNPSKLFTERRTKYGKTGTQKIFDSNGKLIERDEYDEYGALTKYIYDANGKLILIYKYNSAGLLIAHTRFDPNTGKWIVQAFYDPKYYDPITGKNRTKESIIRDGDGTVRRYVYDPATRRMTQQSKIKEADGTTIYDYKFSYTDNPDGSYTQTATDQITGKVISINKIDASGRGVQSDEFDSITGKWRDTIIYDPATGIRKELDMLDVNGNTNKYVYDIATGRTIEVGQFKADGTKIYHSKITYTDNTNGTMATSTATDYDTGKVVERDKYDLNGKLTELNQFDPLTGKCLITVIYDPATGKRKELDMLDANGNTDKYVYDIATGRTIEAGQFKEDGTVNYHRKYTYTDNANGTMETSTATDYNTGKVVEKDYYDSNGNLMKIDAPNPDTGKLIYTVLFNPINGSRTEYISYNADGGKTRYIYNDNGDGYKEVISYDAAGNRI